MAEIKFKCVKCGCEELEEVMRDVIQTSVIQIIDSSGAVDYYPDRTSAEGGEVERYQCHKCGHIVKDFRNVNVGDPEWLVEVLQGKGAENYNPIRASYPGGVCPDCGWTIPDNVVEGETCRNCGHAFFEEKE